MDLAWQAWLTLAVVGGTLALLAGDRLTPDRILGLAALILTLTGVISPTQALAGFWNPGVLTVALLFVFVAALRTTGAIRWIGGLLLGTGRSEVRVRGRVAALSALMSGFINNTPIVATLTSTIENWSRSSGVPASRLLLPMNYATVLGGMCTLIGTSTNLIVAGLAAGVEQLPRIGMFDPFWAALPAVVIGVAYVSLFGGWLLPSRAGALEQASNTREYTAEMLVEAGSPLVGRSIDGAGLRHLKGSFLIELERGDTLFTAVSPDQILQAGDRLVFAGVSDAVKELRRIDGLAPAQRREFTLDAHDHRRHLVELVLSRFAPGVGQSVRDAEFRTRYDAVVVAVSRGGRRLAIKPGDVQLQAGDTLLVEARPGFVERFTGSADFLMLNLIDGEPDIDRPRAFGTLALLAGMVLVNVLAGIEILYTAVGAAALLVASGCVRLRELRRSVDLRLIAAIAFSFALGIAIETSGLARLVATLLQGWSASDPFWSLALVYLIAVAFTELLTNNAAAVLVFPIAIGVANQLGVDPMPFVMAVMIGASAGFITPIGYQTNLMVYGPGGYRFIDYVRFGAPLSLLVGMTVLWSIPRAWPF